MSKVVRVAFSSTWKSCHANDVSIGSCSVFDIPNHPQPALQPCAPPRLVDLPVELPLRLGVDNQLLQVDLGLDGGTVGNRSPGPYVLPLGVRAGRQERPKHQQVAVAARKVQGRVALRVGVADGLVGPAGHVGQQDLQHRVVPAPRRLHDGVPAADVAPQDDVGVLLAEEVHDLGVAGARSQHQRGLVVVVERGAVGLAAEREEELDDGEVAEGGGEVQVRVGQAAGRGVWIVEELRVRVQDALHEEGVVGVDCSPEP